MAFDFSDHTHRRFNPLIGTWIMVAPHRAKRPWQGEEEAQGEQLPIYDPKCYLCPGNKRAKGNENPKYETTFMFENDYAAVKPDQPDLPLTPINEEEVKKGDKSSLLLRAEGVTGVAYVICFNPAHNITLANMSPKLIIPILEAWTKLYKDLLSSPFGYCQIFENKGAAVGCSNPHPHCQVWTTSHIPHEPLLECRSFLKYRNEYNSCMLCDYVQLELEKKERIVAQKGSWIALCPYWAIWPFEVMLLSTRHVPSLLELSKQEIYDLADILSSVTVRYDNLFQCSFPYSMGIHQAPLKIPEEEQFGKDICHIHFHFYPVLLRSPTVRKFLAGFEMLCEPQRDLTAEQAAARLRELEEIHYSEKQ